MIQRSGADRRAYPRIRPAKLGITRVHIRNRQSASLVDLSSGGALLELPFRISPESRVAVQLSTAGEQFVQPALSRLRRAPIAPPVAKSPTRRPIVEGDESDCFAALMLDPAFA